MTDTTTTPAPGPFAAAAFTYHRNGWAVLPLPAGQKAPVPTGWTGARGATPSGADVHAWTEERPDGNIALRLPPHVIGVDVDHYDGKPGALVLAQLEQTLGALPPTWRTTSRDDGASGIRLYRVPEGLRWPGGLGPGIDTIRHDHRYAVVWPSLHPKGGTYRWYTPDGVVTAHDIPHPDDLPDLPEAWVAHFTGGELSADQPHAGLGRDDIVAWVGARPAGHPCRRIDDALTRGLADLVTTHEGGRHDAALRLTNRLAWLAGEGHHGLTAALERARGSFLAAVGADRRPGDAEAEWDRMVTGAVDIAAGAHPTTPDIDPCDDPFAGLIDRSATQWTTPPPAAPKTSTVSPPATSAPAPASSTTGTANASAPDATAGATSTTDEPAEDTHTTWWPRDLDAALDDDTPPEQPAHLTRDDGHHAFYPGRVNGIIGPSESGKTWVALHAVRQAVDEGQHVTVIDFEDSDRGMTARLLAIGLTRTEVREHVAYINPDEPFHPLAETGLDLSEHLDTWAPTLVVVDGFNAAMTLQGLDLKDNKDATTFMQHVLKPIAARGPAVVYIDHTPKDKEHGTNGGIGAQAKRAMTTGCTLRAEPVTPFGKGQAGKIRLHVDKDRLGTVRGASAPGKAGHWFGDLAITSNTDGSDVTLELTAPTTYDADTHEPKAFRPTVYMGRIAGWLADNPGAGRNEVLGAVTGDVRHLKTALKALVDEGWVTVTKHGQKSLHTLDTPFNELLPPPSTTGVATGVGPGLPTPAEPTGVVGLTGGYEVPRSPNPGAAPETAPTGVGARRTPMAGGKLLYDHQTGQVVDATTGEVVDR
ncbi:bifunctional DNA primase/polymerase [Phycicoccus jejuensis]|uniref:bifunctional DNA primase/polymerase n=1 Tax=Phycicoccus jejuensis TaxID=367299 RepID=UPI0004C3F702|nr:bifunctional DNA primase/polymerase [Phycicoccus jejuensis]